MGDQIERGASAAPIPETLDGLRSQNRSYRSLCAGLEAQLAILTKKGREYQEAVSTLDSEREANAILTDEIAALRAENARLREAGKEAEWFMAHYAEYIATVPADEIERHPYLPDLQDKLEALRAALAHRDVNANIGGTDA